VDASPKHQSAPRASTDRPVQPAGLAWPLALLVAWAVALNPLPFGVCADDATAAARLVVRLVMVDRSGSPSQGTTWLFDLPPRARAAIDVDVAAVRPAARPLLQRLAGMVSFDDHVTQCLPPATSCSTSGSGVDGRWGIHLDADTTAFTYPSNRFLVYHEIGHARWKLLLGPDGQQAFAEAVSRALRGQPCINDQGRPCAVLPEMFADEFARYVGGFAASMSYYCTPPLLDAVAFGAVLDAADF
jgi:hypothetical protein